MSKLNDATMEDWNSAHKAMYLRNRPYGTPVPKGMTLGDQELTFGEHAEARGISVTSDGSTASYYELPAGAREIQDLISHKDMNAQVGEIFRECYRYGQASHCDELRGAKKMKFYIDAEIKRLENC